MRPLLEVELQILYTAEDESQTRGDVAEVYAIGLRFPERVNWPRVNRAIIERWSVSGLSWIKTEAWKRVAA